ncbi:MAG: transposase family protein [Acidiferrobacter sp.]
MVPGYDTRPRRWRHLNTIQWKTFIEADVPRVNCLRCRQPSRRPPPPQQVWAGWGRTSSSVGS